MPRGRPPKPQRLHILDGTFRAHRHEGNEPEPAQGMPTCPRALDDIAKKKWKEVVKAMGPARTITKAEACLLEDYCILYSQKIAAAEDVAKNGQKLMSDKGHEYPNPSIKLQRQAMELMHKIGSELGIGVITRTRLRIGPKEQPAAPQVRKPEDDLPPPTAEVS